MNALSDFFKRLSLLRASRRALREGRLEASLELLDDPCLAGAASVRPLRESALDRLRRRAVDDASSGRIEDAERALRILSTRDPARAALAETELASQLGAVRPEQRTRKLAEALADMRRGANGTRAAAPSPVTPERSARPPPQRNGEAPLESTRFFLGVDDSGEFLVASGTRIVLGHSRCSRAALRFLADIEDEHAVLHHAEGNFHRGPHWILERLQGRSVQVNDHELEEGGHALAHGDKVRLARNLRFTICIPSAASSSAVLELEQGAECEGTMRVILFASGRGGQVGIGPRLTDHVQVPGLADEILLELEDGTLRALSAASASGTAAPRAPKFEIDCPPRSRTDLDLGGVSGSRPVGLSIRPLL